MTDFTRQYYYTVPGEQNDRASDDRPLTVNCCGTEIIDKTTKVFATSRNDYYLIYMFDGSLEGTIADHSITLNAGDLYCAPPNSFYDYRCVSEQPVNYYWVHFTGCDVTEVLEAANIIPLEKKHVSVMPDAIELYKSLFSEYQLRLPHFTYRASLILRNIFSRFSVSSDNSASPYNNLYTSISYIHTHIAEELSIKELAAMEFISEGHYRALFKSIMGTSPHDYIAKQRINLACTLLSNTSQSIENVSAAVGIKDRLYFQRFFKKYMGISPWRYRTNIKKIT